MSDADDYRRLLAEWRAAGQEHVFRFWDGLEPPARRLLLDQVDAVDVDLVARLAEEHLRRPPATTAIEDLAAAPVIRLPRSDADRREFDAARAAGEDVLRAGRVALYMVAGGQGTRLGFDAPKGTFPFGPVSGRTLFEIFARRIMGLRRRYRAALPWIIMTSDATDAATRAFFAQRDFFGLGRDTVSFVQQSMLPALDADGRILMQSAGRLALSPNGHGGCLAALTNDGLLDRLEGQGIDIISYWQVDNPLAPPADPVFIGFHAQRKAEMSLKVLKKAFPLEKLGNWGLLRGKFAVIEYSDLPDEQAYRQDENGELLFSMGSIAIHIFGASFVRRMTAGSGSLPFHRAFKKVPFAGPDGATVKPGQPNAWKFEMFVFDALPFAGEAVALEVRREDEFAPVKNATGIDSAESSRALVTDWNARRLASLGAPLPLDSAGRSMYPVEIDPLLDANDSALRDRAVRLGKFTGPVVINE
jgi:UDP-N-acetylglucosamine/UDP-N-acetylgalactosamine diphosphorylase